MASHERRALLLELHDLVREVGVVSLVDDHLAPVLDHHVAVRLREILAGTSCPGTIGSAG